MLNLLTDTIRRTRQHHAIEHATIHALAREFPGQSFAGYSDPLGFTVYLPPATRPSSASTSVLIDEDIRRAVGDGLMRLQAGEAHLAIHPNCGTNFATSALLVSLGAMVANSTRRHPMDRLMWTMLLVLPLLLLGQRLGNRLQRYTTLAEVGDRWVADVQEVPLSLGRARVFRVAFD